MNRDGAARDQGGMSSTSSLWSAQAEYRRAIAAALAALLIVVVLAFVWALGRTERAVYLGIAAGFAAAEDAYLKTDSDMAFVMPRDRHFHALVVGCRYDFNYDPQFGRTRGSERNPLRRVRSATLVDCPAK
jgi:hypothetical protein